MTKYHRRILGLSKSHINDACVIASQGEPFVEATSYIMEKLLKKRRPSQYISPTKKGQPIIKYGLADSIEEKEQKFGLRL